MDEARSYVTLEMKVYEVAPVGNDWDGKPVLVYGFKGRSKEAVEIMAVMRQALMVKAYPRIISIPIDG